MSESSLSARRRKPAARAARTGDKRERILDAAVRVFAKKGFHATRVSEVAKAAGVATSTVADFERGHVFTDRMLNFRAREETLVLGAATMRRRSCVASSSCSSVCSRASGTSPR